MFANITGSAVTSSFGAPVQTSIMGPHFLVQNVQLGYFLQNRDHCVSLGFFDDSVYRNISIESFDILQHSKELQ